VVVFGFAVIASCDFFVLLVFLMVC